MLIMTDQEPRFYSTEEVAEILRKAGLNFTDRRRQEIGVGSARSGIDAADLVVLDEFGCNLDLTPRYARTPKEERASAQTPRNTPANTTTISSLTIAGLGPSLILSGAVTSAVFEHYIEHILGPSLRPGQIVLLDNLSAHKSRRIEALVAARGCRIALEDAIAQLILPQEAQAFFAHCGYRTRPKVDQWFCS